MSIPSLSKTHCPLRKVIKKWYSAKNKTSWQGFHVRVLDVDSYTTRFKVILLRITTYSYSLNEYDAKCNPLFRTNRDTQLLGILPNVIL